MHVSVTTVKSILFSVLFHAGVAGLLLVGIDNKPRVIQKTRPNIDIVKAVAVDYKELEMELQRLKDIDDQKLKKQQEADKKLKATERKIAAAEKQRRKEQSRLKELKNQQAQEKKKRQQEQKKIAQLEKDKVELEKQTKIEAERKRKIEQERKRIIAAEKQRQEDELKHKEREQALKQQLAEEQRLQDAAQVRKDQQLLQNIFYNIKNRVASNFNMFGLPAGLECVFTVRIIPGGEIINVSLNQSSGNEIFDNRAMVALQKASPLPVPDDAATLDRLKLRQFSFRFRPEE